MKSKLFLYGSILASTSLMACFPKVPSGPQSAYRAAGTENGEAIDTPEELASIDMNEEFLFAEGVETTAEQDLEAEESKNTALALARESESKSLGLLPPEPGKKVVTGHGGEIPPPKPPKPEAAKKPKPPKSATGPDGHLVWGEKASKTELEALKAKSPLDAKGKPRLKFLEAKAYRFEDTADEANSPFQFKYVKVEVANFDDLHQILLRKDSGEFHNIEVLDIIMPKIEGSAINPESDRAFTDALKALKDRGQTAYLNYRSQGDLESHTRMFRQDGVNYFLPDGKKPSIFKVTARKFGDILSYFRSKGHKIKAAKARRELARYPEGFELPSFEDDKAHQLAEDLAPKIKDRGHYKIPTEDGSDAGGIDFHEGSHKGQKYLTMTLPQREMEMEIASEALKGLGFKGDEPAAFTRDGRRTFLLPLQGEAFDIVANLMRSFDNIYDAVANDDASSVGSRSSRASGASFDFGRAGSTGSGGSSPRGSVISDFDD